MLDSEELHNFVSSAQSLLEQFKNIHISDHVVFRLFPVPIYSGSNNLTALAKRCLALREDLYARLVQGSDSTKYIWFKEAPLLRVIIQPADGESVNSPLCYVEGSFRVGDYIDDEWFTVRLLLEITKSTPDICVSIVDSDGQFLLIETAEHIPDWLEPENSDNRVWLYRGKVHVLPREAGGLTKSGDIKLISALQYISRSGGAECSEAVQSTLLSRLEMVSSARVRAMRHNVTCYLPRVIALLLDRTPGLLSSIIEELDTPSLRQGTGGRRGGQSTISNTSLWRAILGDDTEMSPCLCVSVIFTRPLFAKLVSKPFRSPSVLGNFRKNALKSLTSSGGAKEQAAKNVEVSCRLLVGLALLMQAATSNHTNNSSDLKGRDGKGGLHERLGLFDTKIVEALKRDELEVRGHPLCAMTTTGDHILVDSEVDPEKSAEIRDSRPVNARILHGDLLVAALFDSEQKLKEEVLGEIDTLQGASLANTDSDSWLKLSDQEFRAEMESRTRSSVPPDRGPSTTPPTHGTGAGLGTETNVERVDNLVTSVRRFVLDPDEEEGECEEEGEEGDGVGDPLESLSLDMAKVLSIVDAVSNGNDAFPSQSQEDEKDQEHCKRDEVADLDFDEYQEAMERELQGSSMAHTFERGPPSVDNGLGDIDIDKNLVQNLMEAQVSQGAEGGPTAHLLSLFGSRFPDPDETSSDSDTET